VIEVRQCNEGEPIEFDVIVDEGGTSTRHRVTMSRADCDRLSGKHSPSACLEAAFRFLLDREPKESILRKFDVSDINGYFPDFEKELPSYLAKIGKTAR
jgi:hypothetical protein